MRGDMGACSFQKLVQLLDKQLELDEKLEVLEHLHSCRICLDAVYRFPVIGTSRYSFVGHTTLKSTWLNGSVLCF
jgi:hypothetical protein